MRLKDKINRMESGEILDLDDNYHQTEAHNNRFLNQNSKKNNNNEKSKKNGG